MKNNNDIIYALVARGASVLSECFTSASGNAAQVTRMLLNKIPNEDSKMSYESNDFMIHYIVRNTITYLCVAGNTLRIDLAFEFLDRIQNEFEKRYGANLLTLKAYEINNEFMIVLGSQMKMANQVVEGDHLDILKKKVDEIEKLAEGNLERFLQRSRDIDLIKYKSTQLHEDAKTFEKGAIKLKRHFFWKNLKTLICLFLVLLVVIYLIISMMCGFDFKNCA